MDGWGHSLEPKNNAVAIAKTPNFDYLINNYPHGLLAASGEDVGLPEGQVGNSEVGHMNIGAGRIVLQDLPRLNRACKNGSLQAHPELLNFAKTLNEHGGKVHLIGLISSGGVHAHQDHMLAIANGLDKVGANIIIHAFTDGRDVLPNAASDSFPKFISLLPKNVSVGTVTGRYFGMDRDQRWERTQSAYNAIAIGSAKYHAKTALQALKAGYSRGESDEFLQATIIENYDGMCDGDGIIMLNFRADRVRQILDCLYRPRQTPCKTKKISLLPGLGMTTYSEQLKKYIKPLYTPINIPDTLGHVISAAGLKQLRLAETEKYPHVTFFLNGGVETIYKGEDRSIIPSPKVKTYDQLPQMSAPAVLKEAVKSLAKRSHEFVVINFANPDMVGHTGNFEATIKAVETVDSCVGELVTAVKAAGGQMLLTSDHGNCELMWDSEANSPHTAHTNNLVPLILINAPKSVKISNGRLADLAPSLLAMLGIEKPTSMSGNLLFNI